MVSQIETTRTPISFSGLGIKTFEPGNYYINAKHLYTYIGSLFLLRQNYLHLCENEPEQLQAFDDVLAAALMILVRNKGIDEIMGRAFLEGWVDNGADILPFIEPFLRSSFEQRKETYKERLANLQIIGVVGKIASGKGTIAKIIAKRYDVLDAPFSNQLRNIAITMGFEPPFTREQLRAVNDFYKPAFGSHVFVEWTLRQMLRKAKSLHMPEVIVVDGFRSVPEAQFFLEQPNTTLIGVVADLNPEIDRQKRFERQLNRKRGTEDSLTWDRFMRDDEIESAWIQPVLDFATQSGIIIVNDGEPAQLEMRLETALANVLPEPSKG